MQPCDLRSKGGCAIISFMKRQDFPTILIAAVLILALLSGCSMLREPEQADPHAGMIEVNNGAATVWVRRWDGVEQSLLTQEEFSAAEDGTVTYTGTRFRAEQGIDVSYFQGEIDWSAVAASGVRFAYIRAGYRGYVSGEICADERFEANAAGAKAAGLEVGLYFFSQAVTPEEAEEEAAWLLDAASRFDVTLPLAFDWEAQTSGDGDPVRTDGMLGPEITACAAAFCSAIRAAGRTPAVYANRWQGYYDYDLSQLGDAELWISAPGEWDDFYYAHSMWQYSYESTVPGIAAAVDRNLRFVPITE